MSNAATATARATNHTVPQGYSVYDAVFTRCPHCVEENPECRTCGGSGKYDPKTEGPGPILL